MKYFLSHYKEFILNYIYKFRYKKKDVLFLRNSLIDRHTIFEGNNSIGENSKLKFCFLGRGTYIGRNNELNKVKFGKFCSVGSFITNTTGNHPTKKIVSTHPAFFSTGLSAGFTFVKKDIFKGLSSLEDGYLVEIGNDVWIGDHVTILDGITIGDGAIIGSKALVTKNIEPYSINVGVPAKKIDYRFNSDQILKLKNLKWWDNDFNWIKNNVDAFSDIDEFFRKINL
ncbi:CatB-related O-acetyltransferase [Algoriphagus pacificus]|uniref:CatB-related O-acetyltransferase n=1 Tax=Algoriphagus pacificus TaxID=2811234 RepID=A0ABS3CGY5_9BACT|nr:CatB-related O-acetyltransferase [Algoriphagus pacificus]MBN7816349.1 CatB-related O-acetyltransferase [Algoriphagus pacificus]